MTRIDKNDQEVQSDKGLADTSGTLTTRQLASAIGVSESSIKRWVDDGTIRASRTVGGHRRISRPEAVRLARALRATVARPELLDLAELALVGWPAATPAEATEQLFASLRDGQAALARGIVQSLYVAGHSVAAIVDGPLQRAMERIGELWRHEAAGIAREHRATDIAIQALNQLRTLLSPTTGAPVAAGGAPAGDPYVLPSLAAATVLTAEGLTADNLGPDTPFVALRSAVSDSRPALVWLSLSRAQRAEQLVKEIASFARAVRDDGVSVVVGGRGLATQRLPAEPNLHAATSMVELAAFARGLITGRR